jgi:HK97 gp10 family phage protein
MADLQVQGLDDMRRRMNGLADRLVAGAIKAGLRQGANIIKAQAKANFNAVGGPNDLTRALKSSIRVTPRRGTPTRAVVSVVAGELTKAQTKKFGADSAFYALWVEKGHINRKLGEALRGSKSSVKTRRAASTNNTPAHPFMRPAIDAKAQEAINAMIRVIGEKLPEAAR